MNCYRLEHAGKSFWCIASSPEEVLEKSAIAPNENTRLFLEPTDKKLTFFKGSNEETTKTVQEWIDGYNAGTSPSIYC